MIQNTYHCILEVAWYIRLNRSTKEMNLKRAVEIIKSRLHWQASSNSSASHFTSIACFQLMSSSFPECSSWSQLCPRRDGLMIGWVRVSESVMGRWIQKRKFATWDGKADPCFRTPSQSKKVVSQSKNLGKILGGPGDGAVQAKWQYCTVTPPYSRE